MKTPSRCRIVPRAVCCALLLTLLSSSITPLNAAPFIYRGRYLKGKTPAKGKFDFQFSLYDDPIAGAQIGASITVEDVVVRGGNYTVELDFGESIDNHATYLAVGARKATSTGVFTVTPTRLRILPDDPFAGDIVLPISAGVQTSETALSITNTTGEAAEFRSASAFASVYIANSGQGGGLRVDTSSTGQGSAITSYNYGNDRYAGEFEIINSANPRAAIYARTAGNGQAIDAEVNSNTNGDALFARTTSSSASSYAGVFVGNVSVSGNLTKSSGTFKIDHPIDPANKYLSHSFVESPEMKNIYDGVVTLGENGGAVVTLPSWFQALNRDFRYQLTALGAPAPGLHVAQEVQSNQFVISGGNPGQRISWQVTGVRQDAYAVAHPLQVEEMKAEHERGFYLTPVEHGQPAEMGIDRVERPVREDPDIEE